MLYSGPIIENNQFKRVVIIQSEFSQIRGYLTAKKQLKGLRLTFVNQPGSSKPYWNKWTWMFHRIGWSYTQKTISRLIKYRLKGDL